MAYKVYLRLTDFLSHFVRNSRSALLTSAFSLFSISVSITDSNYSFIDCVCIHFVYLLCPYSLIAQAPSRKTAVREMDWRVLRSKWLKGYFKTEAVKATRAHYFQLESLSKSQ